YLSRFPIVGIKSPIVIPRHTTIAMRLSLHFSRSSIDPPVDAKLVSEHSELVPPELLLERHVNLATLSKLGEDFFEFAALLTGDAHMDIVAELHPLARLSIAGHNRKPIIFQSRVKDHVLLFGRASH